MLEGLRDLILDSAPSYFGRGSGYENTVMVVAVVIIVAVFFFIARGFRNLELWKEYDEKLLVSPTSHTHFPST